MNGKSCRYELIFNPMRMSRIPPPHSIPPLGHLICRPHPAHPLSPTHTLAPSRPCRAGHRDRIAPVPHSCLAWCRRCVHAQKLSTRHAMILRPTVDVRTCLPPRAAISSDQWATLYFVAGEDEDPDIQGPLAVSRANFLPLHLCTADWSASLARARPRVSVSTRLEPHPSGVHVEPSSEPPTSFAPRLSPTGQPVVPPVANASGPPISPHPRTRSRSGLIWVVDL